MANGLNVPDSVSYGGWGGRVNNDSTYNHVNIDASAGETLLLDASSSFDPDNDALHYEWMVYYEPGSYKGTVSLNSDNKGKCKVIIPNDARDRDFHVILVLTDSGEPSLTAYRRFVIDVK